MERVRPYLENKALLRESDKLPEVPLRPEVLDHLDKVEKWGFPNPGTWMDQPKDYIDDLEAARHALQEYKTKKLETPEAKVAQQAISFADAPAFEPLVKR